MPSSIDEFVFSEPSGRLHALAMFSGAAVFAGLAAYNVVLGEASSIGWLVVMTVGATLSGLAESLPKTRRRAAGVLRIAAILLLSSLLVVTIIVPEFVV